MWAQLGRISTQNLRRRRWLPVDSSLRPPCMPSSLTHFSAKGTVLISSGGADRTPRQLQSVESRALLDDHERIAHEEKNAECGAMFARNEGMNSFHALPEKISPGSNHVPTSSSSSLHLRDNNLFSLGEGTCSLVDPSRLSSASQSCRLYSPTAYSLLTLAKESVGPSFSRYHGTTMTPSYSRLLVASFSTEAEPQQRSDPVLSSTRSTTTTTPAAVPSRRLGTTKVPTPPSAPQSGPLESLKNTSPKNIVAKGLDMTVSVFRSIFSFLLRLPANTWFYLTHPNERREKLAEWKKVASDELHHYWVGTKLLWADIQTAQKLLYKTLQGTALTRRERKQLLRTVSDLFRLVPFSMFVIIPFMEFTLPFALRIFPNLLPSTYQDSLKAEENMKRELKSRIAMAQFFQETLEELAKEQKRMAAKRKKELVEAGVDGLETINKQEGSAASMLEFIEKARNGEMMPPEIIIQYATFFQDDLTLDNMPRMQLINMCKYMSIPPYGSDSFLRFQLRHKIRSLKEDDQRILWEGIDSLTKMELREACQERGMRSTGLSKDAYKRALQQWLDLSVNKNVPISLLIMSRTFFLREDTLELKPSDSTKSLTGLADAISGLDKEVLNEVILEVATSQEKLSNPDVRKIKLEVLSQQNELIRKEELAREAAAKKKEAAEKEKPETPPAVEPDAALAPSQATGGPAAGPALPTVASAEKKVAEEEDYPDLSTEEMDAISQLISDDPVSKERAELQRIKAAMKGEEQETEVGKESEAKLAKEGSKKSEPTAATSTSAPEPLSSEDAERIVADAINKLDEQAASESEASTTISKGGDKPAEQESEDPIVARLKKRIETMVDKIEVQLSNAKVKIGDKLHYLDKDRDGILSREEMADALQQVLKRKISSEEAMEIASDIDENCDGVFTVEELIKWIDENKLVRFVEEDRDVDMARIFATPPVEQPKDEQVASTKT